MNRLQLPLLKIFSCSVLIYVLVPFPTLAQVVPDATLPIDSAVTNQGKTTTIEGGTKSENNLFHSFEQFSIPTGSTVYFNNTIDVQNILSRVTGSSISDIDGLIQANGTANLFLINPNGVIFGPSATLNIGGSFFASTASSIHFADGTQFRAKAPTATPLLTVSVPVGLDLTSNSSGEIKVQGTGESAVALTTTFAPLIRTNRLPGLQVQPGKTLALVGGKVVLEGGILTAPGGRVEIGSVTSGLVRLNSTSQGWILGYEDIPAYAYKDILLSQSALIDASGNSGGTIQIQGSQVKLTNGSVILIQNQGLQPSGNLSINAVESLELNGTSINGSVPTTIRTQPVNGGNGGDIIVSTGRLVIQDGAGINSTTYGFGKGGNLNITVSDAIDVLGSSPIRPSFNSNLAAYTFGTGNAGNVTVSTKDLTITYGGAVNSSTLGSGRGGNVNISTDDTVKLTGGNLNTFAPSLIGASAFNTGNAGTVKINTSRLIIEDGSAVNSSALSSGSAGSVLINASESVELTGNPLNVRSAGTISSSAYSANPVVRQIFKLPLKPSGRSGDVTIDTKNLSIRDGGLVSVKNDGESDAGILKINVDKITLENKGQISAVTTSGEGGDINIQSQNLLLRNSSGISTTAGTTGGSGNGGDININTGTLTALGDSDITANAFEGRGGNIQVTTQGLFRSPDSTISASSKLGINGTVSIQTLGLDVRNTITPLQNNLISPEQIIAGSCLARRNAERSSFVITGSGGLPVNPYSEIEEWETPSQSQSTLLDSVQPEGNSQGMRSPLITPSPKKWELGDPIVEAQGIVRLSDGRVLLDTKPQNLANAESLICKS